MSEGGSGSRGFIGVEEEEKEEIGQRFSIRLVAGTGIRSIGGIMKDRDTVLLEGLKLSVDLYKHENELNWSKFRHGLYGMIFLAGAYGFAHEKAAEFTLIVCSLGVIGSFVFFFPLRNGLECVDQRSTMVCEAEILLENALEVDLKVGYEVDANWWRELSQAFRIAIWVVGVLWALVFVYSVLRLMEVIP